MSLKLTDIKSLGVIKDVCEKENISYWVDAGSLLFLLRDNKFPEQDDDIDIGLWNTPGNIRKICNNETLKKLYQFRPYYWNNKINKIMLTPKKIDSIEIHLQPYNREEKAKHAILHRPISKLWFSIGKNDCQEKISRESTGSNYYLKYVKDKFGRKIKKFKKKFSKKISGFRKKLIKKSFLQLVTNRQFLQIKWPYYGLIKLFYYDWGWYIPLNYFEELESVTVDNKNLKVPQNPEKYLEMRYGNWKIPKSDWSYYEDDKTFHKKTFKEYLKNIER